MPSTNNIYTLYTLLYIFVFYILYSKGQAFLWSPLQHILASLLYIFPHLFTLASLNTVAKSPCSEPIIGR